MLCDIRGIVDISGFGGKYEEACQTMLQTGYEWIEKHPDAKIKVGTYKGVYGVLKPMNDDTEKLSEVVTNSVKDCTGAMHQAVMQHLSFIAQYGVDKWQRGIEARGG